MRALRCTISALYMMANASCAGSEKSIAVSLVREDQEEINPWSLISYDTNLYDWLYLGNGDRAGCYLLAARGEYVTLP